MVQDGSTRASKLLGERPRYDNTVSCNNCAGCLVMAVEKACHKCRGCLSREGCVEYTRLCFGWDRVVRNHFSGSIATSLSSKSNFDLATDDLVKYEKLVSDLKDASINLDVALDTLPPEHPHRTNPRYSAARLGHDVTNEETQLSRVEELLKDHLDFQEHMSEVETNQFLLEGLEKPRTGHGCRGCHKKSR